MSAQNQDNNEEVSEDIQTDTETHETEEQLDSPEKNADSLEAQLEDAQAKASENWEQFIRTKAEMDNLRRRNTKDIENAHKFGTEKFVTELLPMLQNMMQKLGIEEIDPMNEKFDAEKHQAMTMQPNADVEPNTVIAVMQKGYSLNDRLIRPAMVMVSKAVEEG